MIVAEGERTFPMTKMSQSQISLSTTRLRPTRHSAPLR